MCPGQEILELINECSAPKWHPLYFTCSRENRRKHPNSADYKVAQCLTIYLKGQCHEESYSTEAWWGDRPHLVFTVDLLWIFNYLLNRLYYFHESAAIRRLIYVVLCCWKWKPYAVRGLGSIPFYDGLSWITFLVTLSKFQKIWDHTVIGWSDFWEKKIGH